MTDANPTSARSIDPVQLRALLRCYWRLSTRGRMISAMGRRRTGKPLGLIFVTAMYMFLGLTAGSAAFFGVDVFTFSLILHSMTFFVVGSAATLESGDVLFNASESDVLGHRPIHPRTLLLAKWINLVGLSIFLGAALNFFPVFFGLAARGARWWFPITHVLSVVLLCVFCSMAVVCVYGLIIRFFDREKFDNFAAWAQVAMSFLFIGGYQILPRVMTHFSGLHVEAYAAYLMPLPPVWFAAIDAIGSPEYSAVFIDSLVGIGLASTALLTYFAIGKLAPSYAEALAKLSETRRRRIAPPREGGQKRIRSHSGFRWWLRDPVERASFRLAATYMRRDRETKLRLYPQLGSFLIFPVLGLLDRHRGTSPFIPLMTVWILGTLPIMAMETLRTSSQAAAADIFAVAPLRSSASIFFGVRKATIVYLLGPALCVAAGMIALLLPGGHTGIVLAIPGLVALPVISLLPACVGSYLPLSRPPQVGSQASKNVTVMFGAMLTMGILAGASYAAWKMKVLWVLLVIEIPIVAVIYRALVRYIKRRPLGWD
jgi:ABC-2 type transport system permease protein